MELNPVAGSVEDDHRANRLGVERSVSRATSYELGDLLELAEQPEVHNSGNTTDGSATFMHLEAAISIQIPTLSRSNRQLAFILAPRSELAYRTGSMLNHLAGNLYAEQPWYRPTQASE